jgi:hypothetical protein
MSCFYNSPMERIPIRELNQHTGAVQARGQQHSEVLEVTRRARITPATSSGPIPRPAGPVDNSIDSTDIISELREERG